jgi:hypothetical protein
VTGRAVALALLVILAACSEEPAPAPAVPARDVATQHGLRIELSTSRSVVRLGEPVELVAVVTNELGEPVTLGSSGTGPVAFGVVRLSDGLTAGDDWTDDCVPHDLPADDPVAFPFGRAGSGWNEVRPEMGLLPRPEDERLFLRPGQWRIQARLHGGLGPRCGQPSVDVVATIEVLVAE